MAIPIYLDKVLFPNNQPITTPITVSLYYKGYYDASYNLIDSGIPVDLNGNITDSPLPSFMADPGSLYLIKAVNELCGYEYEQQFEINVFCPPGFTLSLDASYCYMQETISATPPTSAENTVPKSAIQYSTCGSYIYAFGYNVNGTGSSTQISTANTYWCNGGTCSDNTTVDGPMNRCALWAVTETSNQDVGYSVCLNIPVGKTYYVGLGCDNAGIIRLDGNDIVNQDPTAIDAQYSIIGACFKVWHIYPVVIPAGVHYLEVLGHNNSGIAGVGIQIYDNTSSEIIAATSDGDLNFLFDSADYVGMPVQLGSGGIGYSCPTGYSLAPCDSPISCKRLIIVPPSY